MTTEATSDQREVLEALWAQIYGAKRKDWPYPEAHDTWYHFDRMLDAGAFVDAALMLVPEGWRWSVTDDSNDMGGYIAEVWSNSRCGWGNATTPALALCAALASIDAL